jgi:hypothetical protein
MRFMPFAVVTLLLATPVRTALAQSNPFDGLNSRGRSYADPALYAQHKAQWLARVEAMPENVDVLEGAADFFNILDRPLALELLQRASALEPNNPKWVQKLAQVHRLNAASGDVAEAQTALLLMERAYAERLLDASKSERGGWNYGNAVHKANLILGRVAVAEGRLADGVTFLRAAGETPGSPQLDSFGPNMSLAKDLLERGETEAVLAYFEACRVFWKMGGSRLDAWRQDVEAGRIPNFGANLRY